MIKVNHKEFEWEQGITVESLLIKLKHDEDFENLIGETATVIVNREVVPKENYRSHEIEDGDVIFIYPPIAGGT
ncbi:sulfur carrier protein ThiS [Natranaerobius thermophilus]|uniref:Thiamine biosynthesis protein ThiS n=1 Tax=Natranaerobius thermophilus (strain ATCC BAA-1301 / DSM 18059 / JW/NM-WN-LF) TaxID=457570 RepID=B2A5Y5_NATTJ|nr:sulfur carrier protein ThiS [Natranaerobius thermophilus]ACB85402.1 thiamine biosynthesis protein ThiS [Natranaerobius thermophilus JW/NM-WN-LF]